MKKCRYLIMGIATVLLTLTGCETKNEVVNYEIPDEASHRLLFFGNKYEPANVEVIEDILTEYMEINTDISISYESIKGADYYSALVSRENAGRLDDVFMINHDTGLVFSEHGSLADLTDLVEQNDFSESMLNQMQSPEGGIYWVPTTVSAFGMYCNLDLLKLHGQSVPTNLGEWENVCDYFVSKGITPIISNNDISIKTLAIAKGFYPLYAEGRQIEAFDKVNSGAQKLSFYLEDGFALAKDFCDKGYIDAARALETEKTSDDLEQFVQGESPFMLTGVWAAGRVKGMHPDFEFTVVPYPILEDGTVLVINPDVRLSVSAMGKNQELAKDFVNYFLQEENIGRFADNQSSFSPLQDNFQPSLSEIQEIVDSYHTRIPVIGSDSHIESPIWEITADIAKGLLSGTDITGLMEKMDEQVMQSPD